MPDQPTGLQARPPAAGSLLSAAEFSNALTAALSEDPGRGPGVVLELALDNFLHLNAAYGRQAGEVVMWAVAERLEKSILGTVARLEGDRFGVLLPGLSRSEAVAVGERVLEVIASLEVELGVGTARVTASVGVAVLDRPGLTAADVLLEADLAVSDAKDRGRNRVAVYDPLRRQSLADGLNWAGLIRTALENDAFRLHCQPVYSVESGEPAQWELLVRLKQESGWLVPPAEFFPTAERFGLVERVDRWVLGQAVRLLAEREAAGRPIRLEVNVTEQSVSQPGLLRFVEGILGEADIDPGSLIVEVGESAAHARLQDVDAFARRLTAMGCGFALDNFGVGVAPLLALRKLPIDLLKIDGTFIRDLPESRADQEVVRALTDLGHGLGQQVAATFVSDDETLELLQSYSVDLAQGHHLRRPIPVEELP